MSGIKAADTPRAKRLVISQLSQLMGSTLLLLYALAILVNTILFFVDRPISNASGMVVLVASVIYYFSVGRKLLKLKGGEMLAGFGLLVLLFFLVGLASGYIFDLSWDGRDYQQKAVIKLAQGWNPVRDTLQPQEIYSNMWLNHYPRGPWIAAATIYKLTSNIEVGKGANLLLMAAAYFTALSLLFSFPRLKSWEALILSLVVAANPVSIYQSLSYYVDGQVGSIITLMFLLLVTLMVRQGPVILVSLSSLLLIGLNIKFNATAYLIVLLVLMSLLFFYLKRSVRALISLLSAAVAGVILAVFVAGYTPYVTNLVGYGHPFYPIYGSEHFNKTYVIADQMPSNFVGQSWATKLFLSIFSPSQNLYQKPAKPIKSPFSFSKSEVRVFKFADVRVGGFGPLFGLIIILSIVGIIVLLFADRRRAFQGLALISIVLISMSLNSEAWWARYAPQLWLVPVIVVIALIAAKSNLIVRWCGYLMLLVMVVNLLLVSAGYFGGNLRDTICIRKALDEIAESGEEMLVYYGPLESTENLLKARDVHFRRVEKVEELPCPILLSPGVFYSLPGCSNGILAPP